MTLETHLAESGLALMGLVGEDQQTIALLGPLEPDFWRRFTAAPEYRDGAPDPLDRYSKRVIGALATALNARALFPSDGPPYPPFLDWARASGRCHLSPVGLLVHDTAGLWLSFRGALRLPKRLPIPAAPPSPCATCAQPCRTACPVGALGAQEYDVAACHAWLDTPQGAPCMTTGCAVRRACPVGATYGRLAAQSAFHMKAFHQ